MSSSFQLTLGRKTLSLNGFDSNELKTVFDFCNKFFEKEELDNPQNEEKENKSKAEQEPKSIDSLIPPIMDFDALSKYMVQAFPENKIDSNIANCRVLKNLFVTYLKLTQFSLRELEKTRYIIDSIKHRPPIAQKATLSAVSKAFQMYKLVTPQEIIERMHELTSEIEGQMKTRIMSEKEKKIMISEEEVNNLLEKYKNSTDLQGKQYYLMLLLYTQMEPLRLDYVDMLVGNTTMSETENCLNYLTGHIFLRKYKTSDTYGEKVLPLPKFIQDYVIHLVKWRKENNITSPYLFLSPKTLTPLSKPSFCKSLNNIFGKTVSVNILRKFYVSSHIDANALKKAEEIASKMCHDTKTQQNWYCKDLTPKNSGCEAPRGSAEI